MSGSQDTELTLSTGKLLAIFFGMVVICGIFFSLGYAVGKNAAPSASATIMDSSQLAAVPVSGSSKPAASKAGAPQPCGEGNPNCTSTPASQETTAAAPAPEQSSAEVAVKEAPKTEAQAPPEMKPSDSGSGFAVQVAAVGKQEDADALASALRKKQYPVYVVNNPATHLFHVQVGPFGDQKEAESMRAKLAADGYNAILKR